MTMPPPPRNRLGWIVLQPNVTWDSEAEMKDWLKQNLPQAEVVKTWTVTKIACQVWTLEPKALTKNPK